MNKHCCLQANIYVNLSKRENQLAVMFKGNVTLPLVLLAQKWVTGGINIHCLENG